MKSGNLIRANGKNLNTACKLNLTFKYDLDTIVPKMNECRRRTCSFAFLRYVDYEFMPSLARSADIDAELYR